MPANPGWLIKPSKFEASKIVEQGLSKLNSQVLEPQEILEAKAGEEIAVRSKLHSLIEKEDHTMFALTRIKHAMTDYQEKQAKLAAETKQVVNTILEDEDQPVSLELVADLIVSLQSPLVQPVISKLDAAMKHAETARDEAQIELTKLDEIRANQLRKKTNEKKRARKKAKKQAQRGANIFDAEKEFCSLPPNEQEDLRSWATVFVKVNERLSFGAQYRLLKPQLTEWPSCQSSTSNAAGIPFDFLEFGMRYLKQKVQFEGFRYKLHPKTGFITAAQILFSQGFTSPVVLHEGETADNMIVKRLKPGQKITQMKTKQTKERKTQEFFLQDGTLFAHLLQVFKGLNAKKKTLLNQLTK